MLYYMYTKIPCDMKLVYPRRIIILFICNNQVTNIEYRPIGVDIITTWVLSTIALL